MYQEGAKSTELLALLGSASAEFPAQQFPALAEYMPAVSQAVERAWSSTLARDYPVVREVVESFWMAFSSFLRVDERGHSGVGKSQVEEWSDFAQMKLDLFTRAFGDIVVELDDTYGNVASDAILGPVFANRRAEQTREKALIDQAIPYLEGLEDTLNRLHLQPRG